MLLGEGAGKPDEAEIVDGSTKLLVVFCAAEVLDEVIAGSVTVTMLDVEAIMEIVAEDVMFCVPGLEPLTGEVSFDGKPGKLLLPAGKPGNELLPPGAVPLKLGIANLEPQ